MKVSSINMHLLKSMASKSKHNNAEIALAIKLYKERKIERFDTARNIINDLSSRGIVKQQKAKDKLNFYDKEYIPRSDPLSKTITEGRNRFIKPETKTIINITGKKSSWNNRVVVYEDRINCISKENEFDNISIDNQRILQVIHKIKTPGRYLMNIYNKYTDPETTVSPACDRYSDDFYITIPEAGLSTRLANDSINNYLPSKRDSRRYKKAINKFEDEDDSDVSTDIDSINEITDLYEPCDAVK